MLTFDERVVLHRAVQGYLAHKKQPPPLGPPYVPRHSPSVGSQGGAVSYERGTPVSPAPERTVFRTNSAYSFPHPTRTVCVCVCVCVCVFVCVCVTSGKVLLTPNLRGVWETVFRTNSAYDRFWEARKLWLMPKP